MKAVSVALVEPRQPSEHRNEENADEGAKGGGDRRSGRSNRKSSNRNNSQSGGESDEKLQREVEKLRRKQERLISILVEKGIMQPGEIDGLPAEVAAEASAEA